MSYSTTFYAQRSRKPVNIRESFKTRQFRAIWEENSYFSILSSKNLDLRRWKINSRRKRILVEYIPDISINSGFRNQKDISLLEHSGSFSDEQMLIFYLNIVFFLLYHIGVDYSNVSKYSLPFSEGWWSVTSQMAGLATPAPLVNGMWAEVMCTISRELVYQPMCVLPSFFLLCYVTVNVLERGCSASQHEVDVASP